MIFGKQNGHENFFLREDWQDCHFFVSDADGTPDYHCGYGHGYHRFVTILGQLERYKDTSKQDYYTMMPESAALVILQSAVQNPYTNASGISMTQYSAIYNNEKRTVEVM